MNLNCPEYLADKLPLIGPWFERANFIGPFIKCFVSIASLASDAYTNTPLQVGWISVDLTALGPEPDSDRIISLVHFLAYSRGFVISDLNGCDRDYLSRLEKAVLMETTSEGHAFHISPTTELRYGDIVLGVCGRPMIDGPFLRPWISENSGIRATVERLVDDKSLQRSELHAHGINGVQTIKIDVMGWLYDQNRCVDNWMPYRSISDSVPPKSGYGFETPLKGSDFLTRRIQCDPMPEHMARNWARSRLILEPFDVVLYK